MGEINAAWVDYLTAARRLDTIRREAASVASGEAKAVTAARDELPALQAKLSMQAIRLKDAAAESMLIPGQPDRAAAENAVAGGPAVVLAALRQAKSTVDVADAALARLGEGGTKSKLKALFSKLSGR